MAGMVAERYLEAYKLYLNCRRIGYHFYIDEKGGLYGRGWRRPDESMRERIKAVSSELKEIVVAEARLLPDEKPWLHIARQVLAGEFDGAERAVVERLTIGLRRIRHPICQAALEALPPTKFHPQRPAAD
jgi:hypothetical protein